LCFIGVPWHPFTMLCCCSLVLPFCVLLMFIMFYYCLSMFLICVFLGFVMFYYCLLAFIGPFTVFY
jgi:hypothetical protein